MQPHNGSREVLLTTTEHYEPADSIWGPATVCSKKVGQPVLRTLCAAAHSRWLVDAFTNSVHCGLVVCTVCTVGRCCLLHIVVFYNGPTL